MPTQILFHFPRINHTHIWKLSTGRLAFEPRSEKDICRSGTLFHAGVRRDRRLIRRIYGWRKAISASAVGDETNRYRWRRTLRGSRDEITRKEVSGSARGRGSGDVWAEVVSRSLSYASNRTSVRLAPPALHHTPLPICCDWPPWPPWPPRTPPLLPPPPPRPPLRRPPRPPALTDVVVSSGVCMVVER